MSQLWKVKQKGNLTRIERDDGSLHLIMHIDKGSGGWIRIGAQRSPLGHEQCAFFMHAKYQKALFGILDNVANGSPLTFSVTLMDDGVVAVQHGEYTLEIAQHYLEQILDLTRLVRGTEMMRW